MLVKFLGRLSFIIIAVIVIPLAVQNRQMVEIVLNPLALIDPQAGGKLSMPLFVLLIVTLFIGLAIGFLSGWGLGRLQGHRTTRKVKQAAKAGVPLPPRSGVLDKTPMGDAAKTDAAPDMGLENKTDGGPKGTTPKGTTDER